MRLGAMARTRAAPSAAATARSTVGLRIAACDHLSMYLSFECTDYNVFGSNCMRFDRMSTETCLHTNRVLADYAMVCRDCGLVLDDTTFRIVDNVTQFGNRGDEFQDAVRRLDHKSKYSRLHHLRDYFENLRARKRPLLNPLVLDTLEKQLRKYRIRESHEITYRLIDNFLRSLNWSSYREYVPLFVLLLKERVCGERCTRVDLHCPSVLSKEDERALYYILWRVQKVFPRVVSAMDASVRKNFFYLSFFCRKALDDLLRQPEKAQQFATLKTPRTRLVYEQIWTRCMMELHWPDELVLYDGAPQNLSKLWE